MSSDAPVGVVLAGGRGRRLGGDKAIVELDGRPLAHYPVRALREVCDQVVVVAKRDSLLPPLSGLADVWVEPDAPRHPLAGVVHALRLATGRAVLVVAVDLVLVDAATLRRLLDADPDGGAAAVVARADGRLQPLCALYRPAALPALSRFAPDARAVAVVAALGPVVVDLPDATVLLNVNAPEDVLQASALLAVRRG
jgi:molybdopterin-guanine dinucleotide biosynthesis protein A